MKHVDLIVVGGGPAGMAAAVEARKHGVSDILIIERDTSLGGILKQCIHNGFGLHRFGEELTGPEYAARYEREVKKLGIDFLTETIVTAIDRDRVVTVQSPAGIEKIKAGAVVLSMGCRERSRGALNIPGTRPAGVYSAGAAQKFVNLRGFMPGRRVVILGSGDIGLIMARRMTLEGAKVLAVCEVMPYSGGLRRNIEQCLNDFSIPLYLSHTVTEIHGDKRLTGVTVSRVDENRNPIAGTEMYFDCDTLLLSVGLIPENELTRSAGIEIDPVTGGAVVNENRETSLPGVFSCGNVLHVHDLVDYVSEESAVAGAAAAEYLSGKRAGERGINILREGAVRYTVPQKISSREKDVTVYFRVGKVLRDVAVIIRSGDREILRRKKPKVAPGEMERIKISAAALSECGEEISVGVEEL